MGCALQFRNVTLGYDRHPGMHHLDGEVASGALIAVVGPNGAGKSTPSKASSGCSSRSPAASSATLLRRRTSPTFRRPPRSTAPFPSMCMISSPWDCGGTPACSAGWDAKRGPGSATGCRT
jgi:ABC-type glutathione transport system ATPase component